MPIDARIPLMVQPAQIDSPMEMAGNFLKLKELREASMARMRDRQEDEQIRSIFQQSQGDMDGALPQIRQINPLKAAAIEETWTKSRKASAELQKLELERTGKLQELLSQELGNVTDQSSWDHYRAYATAVRHSANLPPPALDETYSPEKVEQYKLNGMALKDQVAQKHQALVDAANAAREERMAADQRADNERQAAAAEQSKRQFETTEARQNREFAVTSGIARAQLGVAQGNLKQRITDANRPAGSEVTKLPAAIAEKVAGVEQSAAVLDNLEKIKKDDWIGPIAGRFSQSKIKTPGVTVDADLAEFSADTATLKNAVIKATTGAAMSEPEAQRIMEQIPDLTDKPEMWAAKAKTTRRNLELLRRRMLELSGVPQGPAATTPSAAPKQAKADPLGIR